MAGQLLSERLLPYSLWPGAAHSLRKIEASTPKALVQDSGNSPQSTTTWRTFNRALRGRVHAGGFHHLNFTLTRGLNLLNIKDAV